MRYETAVLLGEGGAGEVYRAFDPRLGRFVALKFLRAADPRSTERFLREAKAQARVEHELVCKVYEIGEDDRRPYIAMEYIEGETLEAVADALRLDQKIDLVRRTAEAVEAAHATGLIHRDLKPTNILIENRDGDLRPRVVDFGLARELSSEGLTETGMLLGTPAYLSPEQARGEVRSLDARTDIFALGAVLYRLTTGRPPFAGESTAETLVQALVCAPPPPRRLAPEIPVEVETIILRCLEPEPWRRYESARALAEDLGRFLDRERVHAQRSRPGIRRPRRERHHPVAAIGAAAALATILVLLGLGLFARISAARGAVAAQRYGQEVERIAAALRRAYLLPLHDIRPERRAARADLARLEAGLADLPSAGRAPAEGALGRGYLALHDLAAARRHLESAWAAGERSPQVASDLGRALGHLYRTELQASARLSSAESQAARRRRIEQELRDPALRYLRAALPAQSAARSAPEVAYALGLIDFYERRHAEALVRAREASRGDPGLYEAWQLEGDVLATVAQEAWERGRIDRAVGDLRRALSAYARAAEVARSDADVSVAECWRWAQIHSFESDREGPFEEAFAQATAACGRARKVDPDRARTYTVEAALLRDRGYHQMEHATDPRATFDRAVASARQALRLEPGNAGAWDDLAAIWSMRAEYEKDIGIDPRPSLRTSIACGRKAVAAEPNGVMPHLNLGVSILILGEELIDRAEDPRAILSQAAAEFRTARRADPRGAAADNNEGLVHLDLAVWHRRQGRDPRPEVARAIRLFERGLQKKPADEGLLHSLGEAREFLRQLEKSRN